VKEKCVVTTKTFVAKQRKRKYSLLNAGVSRLGVVESLSQADIVVSISPGQSESAWG